MSGWCLNIATVAFLLLGAGCSKPSIPTASSPTGADSARPQSQNEPPLLLKSIGINLDYYDSAINMAGDFRFTKNRLQQNRIWMDFGYVIPGGDSSTGADKANPQPTFILPLGTKVRSLVDGVVIAVPGLYSGDYSIQVGDGKNGNWLYETEHVINPLVKAGDQVSAGQIIAEVSTWSSQGNDGLGMVEIGILHGGNPPEHVCPFVYLDPSLKVELLKKIEALYASWEEFRRDSTLYDQTKYAVPGCLTLAPVPG